VAPRPNHCGAARICRINLPCRLLPGRQDVSSDLCRASLETCVTSDLEVWSTVAPYHALRQKLAVSPIYTSGKLPTSVIRGFVPRSRMRYSLWRIPPLRENLLYRLSAPQPSTAGRPIPKSASPPQTAKRQRVYLAERVAMPAYAKSRAPPKHPTQTDTQPASKLRSLRQKPSETFAVRTFCFVKPDPFRAGSPLPAGRFRVYGWRRPVDCAPYLTLRLRASAVKNLASPDNSQTVAAGATKPLCHHTAVLGAIGQTWKCALRKNV